MRNLEQQTPRPAEQHLRDEPTARRLDTVTPRATRWLWPGRVALGQVTLVAGEPGAGTSLLLMNLASRVSRGRDLGEPDKEEPVEGGGGRLGKAVPHEAADVVLIMRQSMEDAMVPRLTALDADLKRIHDLGDVRDVRDHNEDEEDGEDDEDDEDDEKPTMRPFRADKDLEHLESLLARTPGVKLVVLDPMELWLDERGQRMSYLSRETIRQLGELARRWDVAIVAAARVPDKPGANDMRRWLDKLAGVEELAALFAVVRDRRRPCRRYLAAVKNTLAEVEDALAFETPGGQVAWKRGGVSAAVVWATASRLDQEDAARWLRDELALGPKTAKELRAAADEAGIPWHVVYRAKGIAGADCGRVGSGAGSYFVWSLFDLPEEVEEAQESAKSSIENTKTGDESAECGADPLRGCPGAEPNRFAGAPMQSAERAGQTDASENEIESPQESAKSSIENMKTEEESSEPTRLAGTPEPTDGSGDEIGNAQERADSSIENTKRRVARGARRPQRPSRWRPRAEAEGEAASAQFSDPTECKRHYDALSAQPVEDPWTKDRVDGTPDDERLSIRDGESPPIFVASLSSDCLWNILTHEDNDPELKQEIERVLRERCDPRMSRVEDWG